MSVDFFNGDRLYAVHVKQFAGEAQYAGTSGGTSAAYTVSQVPAPEAGYTQGRMVNLRVHVANAANATCNLNGLGPKSIVKQGGVPLAAGDLQPGQVISLIYDSTSDAFHLVGAGGSAGIVSLASGGTGRDNSGSNIAMGSSTLSGITTGTSNLAFGPSAGTLITSGSFNIALGQQALGEASSKTGSNNIAMGYFCLGNSTSGHGNVAIGHTSMRQVTTGFRNVAIGDSCMRSLTTGNYNVSIGYLSLDKITTQSGNTAVGNGAGFNITTGQFNTLVGYLLCYGGAGATGSHNVGLGYSALYTLTSGAENIAIGSFALNASQSESGCVAIGHQAGYNLSGGSVGANVYLGWLAGKGAAGSTANHSVAVGYNSLVNVSSGIENSALGSQTLQNLSTGQRNLALGRSAGQFVTTGSNNTLMGESAATNLTTGSHNIMIGSGIQAQSASESQQINVGNAFRRKGSQGASSVTSKAATYANSSTTTLLSVANRRGRIQFFDSNNDWAVLRFSGTNLVLESGSAYVLSATPGATELGLSTSGNNLQLILGSSAERNLGWIVDDVEF